jgi:hypothetical protein
MGKGSPDGLLPESGADRTMTAATRMIAQVTAQTAARFRCRETAVCGPTYVWCPGRFER